jgi:hypothetical protein
MIISAPWLGIDSDREKCFVNNFKEKVSRDGFFYGRAIDFKRTLTLWMFYGRAIHFKTNTLTLTRLMFYGRSINFKSNSHELDVS